MFRPHYTGLILPTSAAFVEYIGCWRSRDTATYLQDEIVGASAGGGAQRKSGM